MSFKVQIFSPYMFISPLFGDGSSLYSCMSKELLTSLGLYKRQQQSFQPKAETQIECGVFFQWLLNSFGTVFLKIPGLWEGKWGEWRFLMGCLFYFNAFLKKVWNSLRDFSWRLNLNPFTKQTLPSSSSYIILATSRKGEKCKGSD